MTSRSSKFVQSCTNYFVTDTHEVHSISSEATDQRHSNDKLVLTSNNATTYEVSEGRINYEFFYNRISSLYYLRNEVDSNKYLSMNAVDINNLLKNTFPRCESISTESEDSILNDCDIEQCLMKIEKSLINIEQTLRHLQRDCLKLENELIADGKFLQIDNDINIEGNLHFSCIKSIELLLNESLIKTCQNSTKRNSRKRNFLQSNYVGITKSNQNIKNGCKIKEWTQHKNFFVDDRCNLFICKKRRISSSNSFHDSVTPKINNQNIFSRSAPERYSWEAIESQKKIGSNQCSININSNKCISDEEITTPNALNKKIRIQNVAEESNLLPKKKIKRKISPRVENIENGEKIVIHNEIQIKIENEKHSLQSIDSAIVPNKLVSLSFSLLLAALLQAVRCLADLVGETFRSISFDKYALHD